MLQEMKGKKNQKRSSQTKSRLVGVLNCLLFLLFIAHPVFPADKGLDYNDQFETSEGFFGNVPDDGTEQDIEQAKGPLKLKVVRSRKVNVDIDRIFRETGNNITGKESLQNKCVLHFNLFQSTDFFIHLDKVVYIRSGSTTWLGSVAGDESGGAIFTIKDQIIRWYFIISTGAPNRNRWLGA